MCVKIETCVMKARKTYRKRKKMLVNSSPNDKTLDCSKLKAFAHNNTYVTEKVKLSWEG